MKNKVFLLIILSLSLLVVGCKKENEEKETNSILEIVDETVINNLPCDTALEKFFSDSEYTYYFNCIKSNYVIVKYNDGSFEKVIDAINSDRIAIKDLDRFNINYYKEKK